MKRAEISMTVIVGAIIALLVLIVLSFIVIRSGGNFNENTSYCSGVCATSSQACQNDPRGFELAIPMKSCTDVGGQRGDQFNFCCQQLGG